MQKRSSQLINMQLTQLWKENTSIAEVRFGFVWFGLDPSKPEFFKVFFLQLRNDICI